MSADLGAPLKWPGGKNYLARKVVALMPRHLNYVEPYAGGLSVLFARDPGDERLWWPGHEGVSEVVNDLHRDLVNFWQVLANDAVFQEFRRAVEAVPFSGHHYADAVATLADGCGGPVGRAVAFFVANRQSLAGRMDSFTGVTKSRLRGGMNGEVSAWLSTVEGLPAVHDRLKRVLILPPTPALRVVERFDRDDALFYLDPPYVHSSRVTTGEYRHEMSDADHEELLSRLAGLRGRFMLSGYENDLYARYADVNGWKFHCWELPNHASGAREKRTMTECLWCNF